MRTLLIEAIYYHAVMNIYVFAIKHMLSQFSQLSLVNLPLGIYIAPIHYAVTLHLSLRSSNAVEGLKRKLLTHGGDMRHTLRVAVDKSLYQALFTASHLRQSLIVTRLFI